jgi:lipid-A-disaccharide synthase
VRIVASAGEASGEVLLALFAQEMARQEPACEVKRLQDEVALEPVFGFWEGLRAGPRMRHALDRAEEFVVRLDPDLVVLVSFSGFHLPLGRRLRGRGFRVLYLGPPQVWAWGRWRTRALKAAADRVVCLFGFEQEMLAKAGIDATYLGYPFYDNVTGALSRAQVLDRLGFRHDEHYVVYLPGSRPSETNYHVPLFNKVQRSLAATAKGVRGVIVTTEASQKAKGGSAEAEGEWRKAKGGGVATVSRDRYDVMRYADCACAVSGTVTAELAILGVPMVVSYHLGWASRMAANALVRVKFFALPNLLLDRLVVPEVLDPEPESLAKMLALLAHDSDQRRAQFDGLSRVAAKLGPEGAMQRICALAMEMSPKRPERRTTNRWMPE